MVTTTTILSSLLALAPPDQAPSTIDVASVEFTADDPCAHALALDSEGHFAGEVTICADESGRLDVEADLADGRYLSIRHDDSDTPSIESNYLDPIEVQEGWGGCLFSAAGTAASVVAVQYWWSVGGAISTACECLPLLVEEFEDIECPWY